MGIVQLTQEELQGITRVVESVTSVAAKISTRQVKEERRKIAEALSRIVLVDNANSKKQLWALIESLRG